MKTKFNSQWLHMIKMPCLIHLILTTSVKIILPEEVSSDECHIISVTCLCSYCPTSLQKDFIESSEFTDRIKAKKTQMPLVNVLFSVLTKKCCTYLWIQIGLIVVFMFTEKPPFSKYFDPGLCLRFLYSTSIQGVKIPNANKLVEVIKVFFE